MQSPEACWLLAKGLLFQFCSKQKPQVLRSVSCVVSFWSVGFLLGYFCQGRNFCWSGKAAAYRLDDGVLSVDAQDFENLVFAFCACYEVLSFHLVILWSAFRYPHFLKKMVSRQLNISHFFDNSF